MTHNDPNRQKHQVSASAGSTVPKDVARADSTVPGGWFQRCSAVQRAASPLLVKSGSRRGKALTKALTKKPGAGGVLLV